MDVFEIRQVGRGVGRFLAEFEDCFGRCDTAAYLKVYVSGQNSDLQRKSAEPMALRAGVPPRSLQAFLSLLEWDEERMVDRIQQIVARDHAPSLGDRIGGRDALPQEGRPHGGGAASVVRTDRLGGELAVEPARWTIVW